MEIKIIKESVWYSAFIEDLWIFTEGDTFEDLLSNLKEAIELYYEGKKQIKSKIVFNEFNEFNLVLN
jgi:predicted RNase H-like HicB family nuclease